MMKKPKTTSTPGAHRSTDKISDATSFKLYLRLQAERLDGQQRFGTSKNYLRTLTRFSDFLGSRRLTLKQFDESTVLAFNAYLEKRGVVRNTISFYMRILKAVYNRAVKEGLVTQCNPFENVYTGIDRTRKRSIDERYIVRLKRLELRGHTRLELARDLFLFSFYTRGMPFVDMAYLTRRDICDGMISYTRHKTKQRLMVRVEPCMVEIIDRYSSKKSSPYLFPIIRSDDPAEAYAQCRSAIGYYNRLLKQLGEMIGLKTPLTSYTSRHTWATSALNHCVSVSVISAAMGHASESVTRIYLDSINHSIIDRANADLLNSVLTC